ncbi:TRXB [Hepatospora eriocheir]|uniref:TRXB n=1 Tax=Hepatospora eriocheir TaxID=1081669 RepID=A0A1X0QC32_9MICR|nr:TRXB [Hepatospora eriocheir]
MTEEKRIYDCVIVGSGPASYASMMYLIEKDIDNIVMYAGDFYDSIGPGGQLTTTTNVDNYPGFRDGIQGPDLMDNMNETVVKRKKEVLEVFVKDIKKLDNNLFMIKPEEGEIVYSRTVIIGTGSSAKKLHVEGTDKYWQKGISACAVCDGFIFKDGICAVIGGGDTAMEEILHLSGICKKLYLIHRRETFRARADKLEEVKNTENIEVITNAELKECKGDDDSLKEIILKTDKGEMKLDVDGLFFAIGHLPNTASIKNCNVKLHDNGYIKTDNLMRTGEEGLFACGDVQDFVYRQAIVASESGIVAAIEVIKTLNK